MTEVGEYLLGAFLLALYGSLFYLLYTALACNLLVGGEGCLCLLAPHIRVKFAFEVGASSLSSFLLLH